MYVSIVKSCYQRPTIRITMDPKFVGVSSPYYVLCTLENSVQELLCGLAKVRCMYVVATVLKHVTTTNYGS